MLTVRNCPQCGKTFYSGAVEWWPKKQLRQIDALILTHAHAVSSSFLSHDRIGWPYPHCYGWC
jgi:hypothetical protein